MPKKTILVLSTVMLASLGTAAFMIYNIQQATFERIKNEDAYSVIGKMPEPVDVPAFRFVDQNGEPFDNEQVQGNWTLLFFGFTHCPDICPTTMATLGQFVDRLDTPAPTPRVVLVSVDPERDTPEQLRNYVTQFHPDFVGVTGARSEMVSLSKFFGLFVSTPPPTRSETDEERVDHNDHAGHDTPVEEYTINHSGYVLIIDPDGRYAGRFSPPFEIDEMVAAWNEFTAE